MTNLETKVYHIWKGVAVVSLAYLLIAAAGIIFGRAFNLPVFAAVLILGLWILPVFFKEKILDFFCEDVLVIVDSESLVIKNLPSAKDMENSNTNPIFWKNVSGYKFQLAPRHDMVQLKIYQLKGRNKSFVFRGNSCKSIDGDLPIIVKTCCDGIKSYNLTTTESDKLNYVGGFLTTKNGLIVLMTLLAIIVATVIFLMSKNPHKFPLSFMSIFMVLALFGKRSAEIKLKEKIEANH